MNPDASTQALASIEVDLSPVKEGQAITVSWRGKPVFIRNRTRRRDQEGGGGQARRAVRPQRPQRRAAREDAGHRRQPHQEGQGELAGAGRHLHAPGLHPQGPVDVGRQGRLRRLVLPLPRLALRHRRAASAKGRRRATSRCRPTSSCPTPRSRSAEDLANGHATNPPTGRPRRFGKWIDARLPLPRMMHAQFVDFPDAAQHQLPVDHRRAADLLPRRADRHRHRARHALRADARPTPSTASSTSAAT